MRKRNTRHLCHKIVSNVQVPVDAFSQQLLVRKNREIDKNDFLVRLVQNASDYSSGVIWAIKARVCFVIRSDLLFVIRRETVWMQCNVARIAPEDSLRVTQLASKTLIWSFNTVLSPDQRTLANFHVLWKERLHDASTESKVRHVLTFEGHRMKSICTCQIQAPSENLPVTIF